MTPAQQSLFTDNQRLAYHAAARWIRSSPADRAELVQAALIGLWKGALCYDPARGRPFAAFAWMTMRNAILDCLRDLHHPRRRKVRERHGAVSLDALRDALRRQTSDEPSDEPACLAVDDPAPRQIEAREQVARLLRRLTRRQRQAVTLRYLEGLTGRETARRLNCGVSNVSRLITEALERMREKT